MARDTDFLPFEEIQNHIQTLFEKEKSFLQALVPEADIQHVGSTAIPGALSKLDLDIQIRVEKNLFNQGLIILGRNLYHRHNRLWTNEFAIFSRDNADTCIDYMLTVIDSEHDHYFKFRDFLIQNPGILKKYNSLKRKYKGKRYDDYRKAKGEFLGEMGENIIKDL